MTCSAFGGNTGFVVSSDMITTLRIRVRDRERQRAFAAFLGGKMIGLGVVVFGIYAIAWYFSTKAGAAMLGREGRMGELD